MSQNLRKHFKQNDLSINKNYPAIFQIHLVEHQNHK